METNSRRPMFRNGCGMTIGDEPKMIVLAPYGMTARSRKMKIGPRKTMGRRRNQNSSFSPVWAVNSCLMDISEGRRGDGGQGDRRHPIDGREGLPRQEDDHGRAADEDEADEQADGVAGVVFAEVDVFGEREKFIAQREERVGD